MGYNELSNGRTYHEEKLTGEDPSKWTLKQCSRDEVLGAHPSEIEEISPSGTENQQRHPSKPGKRQPTSRGYQSRRPNGSIGHPQHIGRSRYRRRSRKWPYDNPPEENVPVQSTATKICKETTTRYQVMGQSHFQGVTITTAYRKISPSYEYAYYKVSAMMMQDLSRQCAGALS